MVILSIDVGIKNLALCLLSESKEILLWEVLNISCEDAPATAIPSEDSSPAKCSLCKNRAKYRKNETLYCLRHAKESAFLLPTKDLLPSKIEKMKLVDLKELVDNYSIDISSIKTSKKLKADYVAAIKAQLLDPAEDSPQKSAGKTKASEISLVTISRIMTDKLNRLLAECPNIDNVIIENQISPIATRMTSIQGMLTQYFIMKNPSQQIQYISAKNKLKEFDVDKECYADRKKSGVDICKKHLEGNRTWGEFFSKHKKKDDLADCYLQGCWFLGCALGLRP
jgi:hypothetical protein